MAAAISASQVKDLREKTGVGMMECKKALEESGGDLEKAILWLRERGMSRAAKKADRIAAEGTVEVVISDDQTTGVVLEVNCETDFAAKNADFRAFITSAGQLALKNRPKNITEFAQMKMGTDTVENTLKGLIAKIGENMVLRRVQVLTAPNGVVAAYNHMGGKIGVLVALDGAKGSEIADLGKDIAMHVAASAPRYLKPEDVNTAELETEKELARKKLLEEKKPENIIEKIMQGQVNKFYKEVCLIEQAFVKDPNLTIAKLVAEKGKGAKLTGFTRYALGEGIEKKQDDFAAEVAAAAGLS